MRYSAFTHDFYPAFWIKFLLYIRAVISKAGSWRRILEQNTQKYFW